MKTFEKVLEIFREYLDWKKQSSCAKRYIVWQI